MSRAVLLMIKADGSVFSKPFLSLHFGIVSTKRLSFTWFSNFFLMEILFQQQAEQI